MSRTSARAVSQSPPPVSDAAEGEELARTIAGNIIERDSLVSSAPEQRSAQDEDRNRRLAIAAYYRAERRGFAPGGELEDWLAAEREIQEQEGAGAIG
jgi:Protein of unknown function (DUF2934)